VSRMFRFAVCILPVTVSSNLEGRERPFSVYLSAGGLTSFFFIFFIFLLLSFTCLVSY
jgi:hypothetical protein